MFFSGPLLTCSSHCKKLSWTIPKVFDQYVATSTRSSRIQTRRLRANNSDSHHTGRIQIKGHIQLKDSVQIGACFIDNINNRIQDTRCHRSNNSSSRKFHHQLAATNLEFQQTMSSSNLQF
ncbi:hypothetical protein CR513_04707, partial [Mucuna pruriens]